MRGMTVATLPLFTQKSLDDPRLPVMFIVVEPMLLWPTRPLDSICVLVKISGYGMLL
jgi:hypothetical protein